MEGVFRVDEQVLCFTAVAWGLLLSAFLMISLYTFAAATAALDVAEATAAVFLGSLHKQN